MPAGGFLHSFIVLKYGPISVKTKAWHVVSMNQLLPEPVFPTHMEFSAGTNRVSHHTSVPLCGHRMLGCPLSPILLIGLAGFVTVRAFCRASRNVRSIIAFSLSDGEAEDNDLES